MSGPSSPPSDRIGPYRLLELLGEGGIGEVWLAEQQKPVHRRVALKLIKPGMDTRQVLARLEAERQALAVMDHPNIASFYDAGATEAGRPYFVMELVQGVPITDYCDAQRLSTEERLRLFQDVCHAVQHAHQKGVIHRDLKPSNVLVAVKESTPVVKVIDFGIAKALGHDLAERTLVTRVGQIVGTPEYMSPEQAEMAGLDVDTRTDIYALGVMLYELLVGALPYDLVGTADQAIRHAIRETEVERPSVKLTSLGDTQETIARYRRTTAPALRKELRSDLDWIILKAMEKDRTRRYETADALALEVQRHLKHEPVLAHAPSMGYRMAKFVRRHRFGVATAAAIVVLLVLSAVGMSVQAARIARERDRAEAEAAKARAVNDFLQTMLSSANPYGEGARDVRVADVLDEAAAKVGESLAAQPEVEASARTTLGRTYKGLGLIDEAETQLRRALDLRRDLPPDDAALAESLDDLGALAQYRGDYEAADTLMLASLEMRRRVFGPGDDSLIAQSLDNLGTNRTFLGEYESADSLLHAGLAMRERLLGEENLDVATSQSNLAVLHANMGQNEASEQLFRTALETRRTLQGEHLDVATLMTNLAIVLQRQEKYDEAEPLLRDVLALNIELLGEDHPEVARAKNNLAVFFRRRGRYDEAEPLLRDALAINRAVLGDENPEVSANLTNLALLLRDQGRYGEAEPLFRESLALDRKAFGNDHPQVAFTLNNLGANLVAEGRLEEAAATYRESEQILATKFGDDSWQAATSQNLLAGVLIRMGRPSEAEPLAMDSYRIILEAYGPEHGRTRAALNRVIEVYEALGDSAKVREYRGGGG
ncbi:MAG: serine/threonine-protein kinase [Gemmatimonadota bacterium]|jgi:non-specific serine/threonine protein kinase/serine/threonine-protein kinase